MAKLKKHDASKSVSYCEWAYEVAFVLGPGESWLRSLPISAQKEWARQMLEISGEDGFATFVSHDDNHRFQQIRDIGFVAAS